MDNNNSKRNLDQKPGGTNWEPAEGERMANQPVDDEENVDARRSREREQRSRRADVGEAEEQKPR